MKNLRIRTVSGLVFVAVVAGCLLGGEIPYACLMLFLLISMLYEFYALTLGKKQRLQKTIGILAGVCLWGATFLLMEQYNRTVGLVFLFLLFLLWATLFILQLYTKGDKPFEAIAYALLGNIYIALPLAMTNLLVFTGQPSTGAVAAFPTFDFQPPLEYNGRLLLGLFIILWSADVGAYVFGSLFGQHGRHRLFPSISPKKTWEGLAGGLLTAILAGGVLCLTGLFTCSMGYISAIAALLVISGVFGDLIESMLKRSAGVKDSGRLMPGHGGILDRFDGALLAFPAVCAAIFITELCLT